MTRLFPNPTDRFCENPKSENDHDDDKDKEIREVVSETERREAHIKLIPDAHSLKPLALQCLKKREERRPSALELSERLSELKQSSQYTESLHLTQSSSSDIQQMQQQLRGQRMLTEAKRREAREHLARNTELQNIITENQRKFSRQLQERQRIISSKEQ